MTAALAAGLLVGLLAVAPSASALPTPGFNGEEAREVTDRIFPEAMQTNDFIRFDEGVENLELLVDENPDLLTYHEIGSSYGWENVVSGEHDELPVFAVTVTNEDSAVAPDEKINVLFMLSIHANEKGAREGGMRVIEDFTKAAAGDADTGLVTDEHVQMLDYMRLIFLFPNPDGWAHEMLEYRHNDGGALAVNGVETQNYVRGNGNGTDLNRQSPTTGWNRGDTNEEDHATLKEPEPRAYVPWLEDTFADIHYATDIHGMLYPANMESESSPEIICQDVPGQGEVCHHEGNFVLSMMPSGAFDPATLHANTELARMLDDRMNSDDYYTEWQTLPGVGAWGDDYHGWGTVWDTIGYTDSGFSGDWFAQTFDAPGINFEFSYNHITFDNYYPGLAQRLNDYHVHSTRTIVATFMDLAAQQVDVEVQPDSTAAYIPTDTTVTDDGAEPQGWALDNPADDAYHWATSDGYEASLNQYLEDRRDALTDPGAFTPLDPDQLSDELDPDTTDTLVVPGSAVERLDEDATAAIEAYVDAGGQLVVTDQALTLLAELGLLAESSITEETAYAGYTDWQDRDHALTDGLSVMARQLYEPVPLGYSIEDGGTSPIWTVDQAAFEDAGGTTVGTFGDDATNVGEIPLGEGSITMLGALLPDPSDEFYTPYGVAPYAVTHSGDQVFRNALDWTLESETIPRAQDGEIALPASEDDANEEGLDESEVPLPVGLAVAALIGASVARSRRSS